MPGPHALQRLNTLASDAPLATLRAIATPGHTLNQAGRTAAFHAEADDTAGNAIGPGLGLPDRDARARLLHYTLRRQAPLTEPASFPLKAGFTYGAGS